MFRRTKKANIGGVELEEYRDNILGKTIYQPPRGWRDNTVFPYIEVLDSGQMAFDVEIAHGERFSQFDTVYIRVGSRLVSYTGQMPRERTFFIRCDGQWYEAMCEIAAGATAVVRFAMNASSYDFEVSKRDREAVARTLKAYSFLTHQAPSPPPEPSCPKTPLDPIPSGGGPCAKGPFDFLADGSIAGRATGLRIPPGVQVGEIQLEGYTLKGHPSGFLVVADTQGSATYHKYVDGRWREGRPKART